MRYKNGNKAIRLLIMLGMVCIICGSINLSSYAQVVIEPFQKLLIESMSLSKNSRLELGDFLRDNISSSSDVTTANIAVVSGYIPILTTDEISQALIVYSNRSAEAKLGINSLIYGGIKTLNGNTYGCINIIKEFNEVVTGNPNDMRGIGIVNTILQEMKSQTDITAFAYNGTPEKKIKFEVLGYSFLKSQISSAINLFASLADAVTGYSGKNNFDKLMDYSQTTVNKFSNMEIWEFKQLLVSNSIFGGTPTALTLSSYVGDVNGDNVVNVSDILYFKLYLLNRINEFPIDNTLQVADLNNDNAINTNDLLYMKLYLLNRITSFPKSFN